MQEEYASKLSHTALYDSVRGWSAIGFVFQHYLRNYMKHMYVGTRHSPFIPTPFSYLQLFDATDNMRYSFLAAVLSVVIAVHGYANPMICKGICNNTHDPALIRRPDGTYYRFSTGGKIAVHTAPAITGPWSYQGAAIPAGSKINLAGNQDLWARPSPSL